MNSWETLSDRIYDALGSEHCRDELLCIADEADEYREDLSSEQRIYWRLLAMAHIPLLSPEEALEVARLSEKICCDANLAWLGKYYASMALYYARLIEPCLNILLRLSEPPTFSEQTTWRFLKLRELTIACKVALDPRTVVPLDIKDFFREAIDRFEIEDMPIPEELLFAFKLHFGTKRDDYREAACVLGEAFVRECKKMSIGGSFNQEVEEILTELSLSLPTSATLRRTKR